MTPTRLKTRRHLKLRDRRSGKYLAFIHAHAAYADLTFREWLTNPRFKEMRGLSLTKTP